MLEEIWSMQRDQGKLPKEIMSQLMPESYILLCLGSYWTSRKHKVENLTVLEFFHVYVTFYLNSILCFLLAETTAHLILQVSNSI